MFTILLQTLAELSATLLVLSGTLRGAAVQAQEIPTEPIEMSELDTIKHYIVVSAHQNGVNPDFAIALADIESSFIPTAKNPISSASGVYMFITSTWNENCLGNKFNAYDNIGCAMKMIGDGGVGHWLADPNTVLGLKKRGFYPPFDKYGRFYEDGY